MARFYFLQAACLVALSTAVAVSHSKRDGVRTAKPNWILESSQIGPVQAPCGTVLQGERLPPCGESTLGKFKEMSTVLKTNPGGIIDFASHIALVAENKDLGIGPCTVANPKDHHRKSSKSKSHSHTRDGPSAVRMVVDAQYNNRPRCCTEEKVQEGLAMNDEGESFAWTVEAMSGIQNNSMGDFHYLEVAPSNPHACTEEHPCPMVIQIPGAAGNPWLLVQSHCDECARDLGAMLVSPYLPQDLHDKDGYPSGTSNEVLLKHFIPWTKNYLAKNRARVDASRVYLISQSRGDDTALRTALLAPDVFTMVVDAGKFYINDETKGMLRDDHILQGISHGKLKSIQFHIGDLDTVFEDDVFYDGFNKAFSSFDKPDMPSVDIRLYTESKHSIWYAAWNSMHELIWSATRGLHDKQFHIPLTCKQA